MSEPKRSRGGRPPGPRKSEEEKYKPMVVRFPPELLAELQEVPAGERAALIRQAVRRALALRRAGLEP